MMYRTALMWTVAVMVSYGSLFAAEIEVGAKAPDFTAIGTDGKEYSFASVKDAKLLVLSFTCNNCPVAKAYEDRFIEFTKKYEPKGVKFIAINANNQSEGLEQMKKRAQEKDFNFPYVFDASGDSARAYGARVTPHLFIVKDGKIAYRGAFDDKQRNSKKSYVADAVDALLAGKTPEVTSTKAFGCGIKIKKLKKK